MPALRRIGHKGADGIVPGNTPASFDAALAAGVDAIEFDVLPEDPHDRLRSPLRLAHDYSHEVHAAPTLEAGLTHLAGLGVDVIVDLKLPGYEARVVSALQAHGLAGRALVSTLYMRSLVILRDLDASLQLGWSVPRVRRDYTQSPAYRLPALALLARVRRVLPARAAAHLRAGRCDALMAHWRLVDARLVESVHGAGGSLFAWTVDDAASIRRLEALGVDGVITNDPRLFGAQEITQVSAL